MIGVFKKDDTLITKLVKTALATPELIEVRNKTLDGKWHVQTIGDSTTVLKVTATFTLDEKVLMDQIKRNMEEIKVVFDGFWYQGLINGYIEYERKKTSDLALFEGNFTLLVNTEGVV